MILFLTILFIILSLYISCNVYIGLNIWKIIPHSLTSKALIISIISFLSFSFLIGRILERTGSFQVNHFLIWIGSIWMGLITYMFFSLFISDLLIFILKLTSVSSEAAGITNISLKKLSVFISIIISLTISSYGYYNSRYPEITTLDLTIEKKAGNYNTLKIVCASDIHLGHMMKNSHLHRIITAINELEPDIILLPGDIVDEDIAPVIKNNMGEEIAKLKAPLGVYAVTGNHEYIGGVSEAVTYLEKFNVRFLRDQVQLIDNAFYICGREDRSSSRFNRKFKRKSLQGLLKQIDKTLPVIVMDHQPVNLGESTENLIDLQLSGHTHNGQLFPFNIITDMIFEKSWGYLKKENTHFYISCGVGTWGPPMKVGSKSEIVEINLTFEKPVSD